MVFYDRIKKNINKRRFLFMCKVCELGKIVVNICIGNKWGIDTAKLQKLLVLMHGHYLVKYDEPLFPENVVIWNCGVAIEEVDKQFREFAGGFSEIMPAQLAVIRAEEDVINDVLRQYGDKDVFEINEDKRLKYLRETYYQPNKSVRLDNNEIKRVFESCDDL